MVKLNMRKWKNDVLTCKKSLAKLTHNFFSIVTKNSPSFYAFSPTIRTSMI